MAVSMRHQGQPALPPVAMFKAGNTRCAHPRLLPLALHGACARVERRSCACSTVSSSVIEAGMMMLRDLSVWLRYVCVRSAPVPAWHDLQVKRGDSMAWPVVKRMCLSDTGV